MQDSSFNIFLSDGKNGFAENSIYNSCSVELMKQWNDECIDLTVTSPPYEDFRKYNGFQFDLDETIKQLYRVTKQGGVVVWVVGDATIKGSETGTCFKQALFFKNLGFGAINLEEAKAEGRKPLELCRNHRRSYIKIEPTVKVDQAKVK